MITCAFTGHRKVNREHRGMLGDLLFNAITHAYDLGCKRFIVGGAIGFDTEAARQVIRFRMTHPEVALVVFVPFIGQDDQWSEGQRDMYNYILASANEVVYVSENYDKDCMKRRNYAMAEACDLLIAYVSNPRSGSAQTVRMAEALGKEINNLYSELERNKN